uniref:Putative conserved secreted protein midgut overexpressed n=1 Tax=Rhipicephalus microplus TaxID=6941 RepID=A0A6M2CHB6_RHIMP
MVKTACLILVALATGFHVTSGQQLPFWDANSYVDQMLLSRLPAHREDIDPLVEPAFALHNSHDKRYGPVRFEDSNVTGLSRVTRVQRGDQCASVTDKFPDSANVTCHVIFEAVTVYLNSILTRSDDIAMDIKANVTFRKVLARLDLHLAPWYDPVVNLTVGATFSDLRSTFEGLTETPETQKLIWGYEKTAKDIVARAITVNVANALTKAASELVFPCCQSR